MTSIPTRALARRTQQVINLVMILALIATIFVASPGTAEAMAGGQTWTFRYVGYDPTASENQDFHFDADTQTYSAINTADYLTELPRFTALRPNVTSDANTLHLVGEVAEDMTGVDAATILFDTPLTNEGGTVRIFNISVGSCNADCSEILNPRSLDVGFVSTVPQVDLGNHSYSIDPEPSVFGWNNSDVTIDFHWNSSGPVWDDLCDVNDGVVGQEGDDLGYYAHCVDHHGGVMSVRPIVSIDRTAPETELVGASTSDEGQSVSIAVTGSDALSGLQGFECALNNEPYFSCTSPYERAGLPNGQHTVRVRAVDNADKRGSHPG